VRWSGPFSPPDGAGREERKKGSGVVLQGVLRPPASPDSPFVLEGAGFQVTIKTPKTGNAGGEPPPG
jgi:hypothetical protein